MNAERIMIKKWKKNIYGFLVILLAQSIGVALADMLLKEFVEQAFVRQVIAFVIVGIFAAADASFVFNRIFLLRRLLDKTPVRCRLEDIFLMPYKDDKKIRYVPYPIVRSLEDHKLYLTYGEYSLLGFTAVFNYSDRRNVQCAVYKGDNTPVRLGDIVDMYLLKTVDVPVSVNREKNTIKLKNRKIYFKHINDEITIDIFKNITFFKGAVNLDAEEKLNW